MASSSGGVSEVIKWGAIAVGAYFLYQAFTSSTAAAAAPAPGSTAGTLSLASLAQAVKNLLGSGTTTTPPATTTTPPATTYAPVANESQTASALIDAAGGVNSLNVDQWNYYWYQLGGTVLTPTQSAAVAAAAGGNAPMNVDAYLAALAKASLPAKLPGMSGLGARSLPIPLMFAYGADRRPLLVLPGGRRMGVNG